MRFFFLLACLTSTMLCAQTAKSSGSGRIVGYISADTERYRAGSAFPHGVTDLIIAFAYPDKQGKLLPPGGDWTNLDRWVKLSAADSSNLWLSIGGGLELAENYRTAVKDNAEEFIAKILLIANQKHLRGIDLDMEGHLLTDSIISPVIYEQFVLKLAEALHAEGKLLSGAVATWFGLQITPGTLRAFDYINVMSYDETGPWTPDKPGQHAPFEMMQYDFNYWHVTRGMPTKRINLGIPFYGYAFGARGVRSLAYRNIIHGFQANPRRDFKNTFSEKIWYNGKRTVLKKTQFAVASAGGVMIWDMGQDCEHKRHSLLQVIVKEMARSERGS